MIAIFNQYAEAWWTWMGNMLWQASLLILLVGVVDLLIRKWAWPQVRYTLWLLVLVKLVIPPTWTLPSGVIPRIAPATQERIAQRFTAPIQSLQDQTPAMTDPAGDGSSVNGVAGTVGQQTTARESSVSTASQPVWQLYAMIVWIAGMVLFVAMLLLRVKKLRRWHIEQRQGKTIPPWFHELLVRTAERLKLNKLPAIVFSNEVVTPAVYGILNPVMLLPTSYVDTLSREEAEHVLLHELAHIKRGDLVVHGFSLFIQIVYWFNPLLILVGRQIKHVREMCCDLTIADVLREKTAAYRQTLLDTARALLTESVEPGMGFLGVFEEPYRLVARLKWLEKETWKNKTKILAAMFAVIVLIVPFVLPMASEERIATGDHLSYTEPPWGNGITPVEDNIEQADSDRFPDGDRSAQNDRLSRDDRPSKRDRSSSDAGGKAICITEIARTVEKRFWRTKTSRIDMVSEMWVDDGIAALHERDRTIICDLNNDYFCFVNHNDCTYVETSLPVDPEEILEAKVRWDFLENPWTGRVKRIKDPMDVLELRCDAYRVKAFREIDDEIVEEQRFTVWSTTEVDFDLTPYHRLLENRRLLQPRDKRFRDELREIDGLQMYLEFKESKRFYKRLLTTEVVEIARKSPDEYTFSIPSGYRKKEYLKRHDL